MSIDKEKHLEEYIKFLKKHIEDWERIATKYENLLKESNRQFMDLLKIIT